MICTFEVSFFFKKYLLLELSEEVSVAILVVILLYLKALLFVRVSPFHLSHFSDNIRYGMSYSVNFVDILHFLFSS